MLDFLAQGCKRGSLPWGAMRWTRKGCWKERVIGFKVALGNFREDSMKHNFALDWKLSESGGNSVIGYLTIFNEEEQSDTKAVIGKESVGISGHSCQLDEGDYGLFWGFAQCSYFYLCSDMIAVWSIVMRVGQLSCLVLVFYKIVFVQQEDTMAVSELTVIRGFFLHTQSKTRILIVFSPYTTLLLFVIFLHSLCHSPPQYIKYIIYLFIIYILLYVNSISQCVESFVSFSVPMQSPEI